MKDKLNGEYIVMEIEPGKAVGVLKPMEKHESVLDKISSWDNENHKRYQLYFTVNFFIIGLIEAGLAIDKTTVKPN